jgi:hypothetical protein
MWIKTDGGKLVNLDQYGRLWIEPVSTADPHAEGVTAAVADVSLRVVADDGHGDGREVIADNLSADQAEFFMRELTIRALHAAEITADRTLRFR